MVEGKRREKKGWRGKLKCIGVLGKIFRNVRLCGCVILVVLLGRKVYEFIFGYIFIKVGINMFFWYVNKSVIMSFIWDYDDCIISYFVFLVSRIMFIGISISLFENE